MTVNYLGAESAYTNTQNDADLIEAFALWRAIGELYNRDAREGEHPAMIAMLEAQDQLAISIAAMDAATCEGEALKSYMMLAHRLGLRANSVEPDFRECEPRVAQLDRLAYFSAVRRSPTLQNLSRST